MILTENQVKEIKGLSGAEAVQRLKRDGFNELPQSKKRGIAKIILDVFKEPMFVLLVACGTIYFVLGDTGEAAMLLGFVFVIMGITIYQEGKTEKAIEALRDLSSPRALVIRDGERKRISGKEVVLDDIMIIKEGDRVPADAVLLWGINLSVDESLLTGESAAVRKIPAEKIEDFSRRPGGDDLPFLFSGSLVVQGQGIAKVTAIGAQTEMGKIGKVLQVIKEEKTFLQKETSRLVRNVFVVASILCAIVVVMYGVGKGQWLKGVLSGITLAMAMLPEEFPVVLTVFLALGAWRISKKRVLTRKVAAVETLGAATVLCVDKTGTLTQNKMSIKKLFNGTGFFDISSEKLSVLPENFHEVVEYGILASKKDPFDPMEKALNDLGLKTLEKTEHIHADWPFVEGYPLSKELMALSHVWETMDRQGYVVAAKGAPEAIADLCHLTAAQKNALEEQVVVMAAEGLRVLGVAKASFRKQELPASQHDFNFRFVGLIGMADPVRESVAQAVEICYGAGINIVMITGDYPATALTIAKQIGLKTDRGIITGPELEAMSAEELRQRIRTTNIFSRVVPEQKLLIVNALKDNKEVVAMTGDGVNDAPALKAAHIGIAMGERGTDVARESSDLVLLNDDFSALVEAVRLGRRIFDNLKKAMAYIISVHVPIAGLSLLPVFLGWPIILYPVHIVFLELIIDPACSVVFESEPEEKNIMLNKPRGYNESLFSRRMMLLSLCQGLFSFAIVALIFKCSLDVGQPEAEARTFAFMTLIISNLSLIMTNRSWSRGIIGSFSVMNRSLLWVALGTIVFLCIVLNVKAFQNLFHFQWIHAFDVAIAIFAGVMSVGWFELLKVIAKKKKFDLLRS